MRFARFLCLTAIAATFICRGSDEIQGTVADVLAAIGGKSVGRIYVLDAQIAVPASSAESQFVIRDKTGSVVIRRGVDWPAATFRAGDNVRIRCEVGATASIPSCAFFRSMSLIPRETPPAETRSNWLVMTDRDESARVTKLPRYLTATNILLALGGLVAFLLAILVWNTLLRRLVDRRSTELADERLASLASGLKVEERTRLAVELHDTIVQMLTGVSLEIDAAHKFAQSDVKEMKRHLALAARTLTSCRNDLRNCMWDLRNQTLDDVSMDDAIRRTLAPHLNGTELSVRFSVPREIISDNTALAILRMIRELAINAVRHGRATTVRVAGCIENESLLFSVADDGCGFDPSAVPGVDQGHFGLQGIVERAENLNGEMTLRSAPGRGTKVTVSIALPRRQA